MILMYHNVWPQSAMHGHKYQSITILDTEFKDQMGWLAQRFEFLSLRDYLDLPSSKRRKRKFLAITVDDGTEVTYEAILPIISRMKIPVTLFVSTCQLDSGPLIWGSYLNALCHEESYKEIESNGVRLSLENPKARRASRRALEEYAIESGDPKRFVEGLSSKYPISPEVFRYYRGMTSQQLEESRDHPLVEIGGHSVHHYSLSRLDNTELKYEVFNCKSTLTRLTGRKIDYFAYPNGDYDQRVISCLQESGYIGGFAVTPKNLQEPGFFEIPRVGAYKTWKLVVKMSLYRAGLFNKAQTL